jgi:predicted dehydrogenase
VTRLGVAGLGWLGESLIKDVARVPGLEVVAVQDVIGERAKDVAERYGIAWAGPRFEDLLALSKVDALLINTPNGLHAHQAQLALRAGKDVLVQKPLGLSYADALHTIHVAQRAERLLFVDYTYRFLETMNAFQASLGSVENVRSISAAFHNIYGPGVEKRWFFDPAQSGGGALMDLGVHLLDLALWLLQPRSVEIASVELAEAQPVEHSAHVVLELDEIPFELAVSWNAPRSASEIALEVQTDAATLRWENVDGSFFHFHTLRDGVVLADRETTLREDTLRSFAAALVCRDAPPIDARVYAILDRAYGREDARV